MSRLRCRKVRLVLPAHVFGGRSLSRRDEAHLGQCLVCQADAATYRSMQTALRSLHDEGADAPPWLVEKVMATLGLPERRQRKGALVAAAVLVASAAVAVWGRRRLRPVG